MLANIVLLLVVFGATRWKKYPYLGALVLGLVKGALYFALPLQNLPVWMCVLNGAIGFVVFGALGFALVYFMRRLDRYAPKEVSYSSPGAERMTFKWEYVPLTLVVLSIVFGEMLVAALVPAGTI